MKRDEYIDQLEQRKIQLKNKALNTLNDHKGTADEFFLAIKQLYNEYDCIIACIKVNSVKN